MGPEQSKHGSGRPWTRGCQLPGTPLIRRYQGKDIIVHVRADGGFECAGRIFKSLSKAVSEATGTRWNGFAFYNLGHRPGVKRGEQE
jgi:hypothetical protein